MKDQRVGVPNAAQVLHKPTAPSIAPSSVVKNPQDFANSADGSLHMGSTSSVIAQHDGVLFVKRDGEAHLGARATSRNGSDPPVIDPIRCA
jgi:hypothetical protein